MERFKIKRREVIVSDDSWLTVHAWFFDAMSVCPPFNFLAFSGLDTSIGSHIMPFLSSHEAFI